MEESSGSAPPRQASSWGSWTAGLVVVAIGVFFLLRNFGVSPAFMRYHNWWAVFILIAAVVPLVQAAQYYRAAGAVDANVLHSLTSAAAIATVALIFLFDLSWNRWWPLFVIYIGLWTMFKRRPARRPDRPGTR